MRRREQQRHDLDDGTQVNELQLHTNYTGTCTTTEDAEGSVEQDTMQQLHPNASMSDSKTFNHNTINWAQVLAAIGPRLIAPHKSIVRSSSAGKHPLADVIAGRIRLVFRLY